MERSRILLCALIIVLAIVLIYAVVKKPEWADASYWLANFIESPSKVYRRSNGSFDDAAALALDRATGMRDPSPTDHLLAATIITRNIVGQEHRPELDRNRNPTNRALERSQIRHEMFGRAREHYLAALRGLNQQMVQTPVQRRPNRSNHRQRRRRAPPARPPPPEAGFIMDAALEFAIGGAMTAMQNDPILAVILGGDQRATDPGDVLAQMTLFIDMDLAGAANQTREQVVSQRREAARQAAGGAAGAQVDAYMNMAVNHTNDPQNSHDPGVNGCLRGIVARLRGDQGDVQQLPSLDDIATEIRGNWMQFAGGSKKDLDDALAVVDRARLGEKNIAIDATDEEILRRIWARADDPENADVRAKMRQCSFDNLKDSWEVGIMGRKIVCVGGRTSRQLGSLSMLDHDRRNWEVTSLEQFKNDIFERTKKLIIEQAELVAKSEDPEMAKIGKSYLAKTPEEATALGKLSDEASEEFIRQLKDKINAMVDEYASEVNARAPSAIQAHMLEPLRMECHAAVSL
jgi:hypothetical protein